MSDEILSIQSKFFEIIERMGKGAFGDVYKAKLKRTMEGKVVAIKFEAKNAATKCLEKEMEVSCIIFTDTLQHQVIRISVVCTKNLLNRI